MAGFNLEDELSKIFDDYSLEVERAVKDAAKEAADITAQTLQSTSPKRKGGYSRGWKVKRLDMGTLTSYVVYNGRFPGLTHVLEHGHASRNQYGSYGRVAAQPHIGSAAESGIQRFELGVRARLRK